jgi:hypothetical protein
MIVSMEWLAKRLVLQTLKDGKPRSQKKASSGDNDWLGVKPS